MDIQTAPQLIETPTRRNKLFSLLLGGVFWLVSSVLALWWPQLQLQIVLGYLCGCLLIFIGVLKFFEPTYSLKLTAEGLTYIHRYGSWSLQWQEIILVNQPSFSHGLERRDIPYLGIKLRDLTTVIDSVSPRLASRQIHEQRDILVLACQQQLISLEQASLNFSPFKLTSGEYINGPRGAWLHQMDALNQAFGCHLYIPITSFPQQPQQLIALFKSYQRQAIDR